MRVTQIDESFDEMYNLSGILRISSYLTIYIIEKEWEIVPVIFKEIFFLSQIQSWKLLPIGLTTP